MSHEGLPLKVALVQGLMSRLVLPAPAQYRPQLRRLAALSASGAQELAARAQQLLVGGLWVAGGFGGGGGKGRCWEGV